MRLSYLRWSLQYALLTLKHKWFVFLACRWMGVPLWRSIIHDWSKFTPSELPHYGRSFFGDRGDPEGFQRAWLHHQNFNPHHWEYWITRSGHGITKGELGHVEPIATPMPETYIREMLADWLGASRAYTGSWKITDWVEKNISKMNVHRHTRLGIGKLQPQAESFGAKNE